MRLLKWNLFNLLFAKFEISIFNQKINSIILRINIVVVGMRGHYCTIIILIHILPKGTSEWFEAPGQNPRLCISFISRPSMSIVRHTVRWDSPELVSFNNTPWPNESGKMVSQYISCYIVKFQSFSHFSFHSHLGKLFKIKT